MSKTSFPVGLGPKWKIQKQPLWPGYPLPWTVTPPRAAYHSFEYDIRCFATGAEALAFFSDGWHLTLNEGAP